jgi:preprotein translocase subunit SecA
MANLDEALLRISRNYKGLALAEGELLQMDEQDLRERTDAVMHKLYEEKEQEIQPDRMRELERMILLAVIDQKWMDHIDAMDQLKTGIGLRGIGQQDPAAAYAQEGFNMFELMTESIKEDTVRYCYGVTIETKSERKAQTQGETKEQKSEDDSFKSAAAEQRQSGGGKGGNNGKGGGDFSAMPKERPKESAGGRNAPVKRSSEKVGRNDPCPCGSGKKYKNCCGKEI